MKIVHTAAIAALLCTPAFAINAALYLHKIGKLTSF